MTQNLTIKERRQALRLKQFEVAQIVGIRPETMSRIERGVDDVPAYLDLVLALIERGGEDALRFAMARRGLSQERETA